VISFTQRAVQDDVTVENTADFVGDRLLHVAAGDEHRVQRGDGSGGRVAGALEQPR
jgi:hypothetical protein